MLACGSSVPGSSDRLLRWMVSFGQDKSHLLSWEVPQLASCTLHASCLSYCQPVLCPTYPGSMAVLH